LHILLTDVLTCPRCGPTFGLVLQAERIEERDVQEGRLGCPNCRATFSITDGVAELQVGDVPALTDPDADALGERAFRAAALLGTHPPNATLLVVERAGLQADEIASIHATAHVVGASLDPPPIHRALGVLSRVLVGTVLPFRDHAFRGVAVLGDPTDALLRELARVLSRGARLVVDRASPGLGETLRDRGFQVHLEQDGVVVAAASGPG
jgi:uncharacterized protein YbaR (Trm112 family)